MYFSQSLFWLSLRCNVQENPSNMLGENLLVRFRWNNLSACQRQKKTVSRKKMSMIFHRISFDIFLPVILKQSFFTVMTPICRANLLTSCVCGKVSLTFKVKNSPASTDPRHGASHMRKNIYIYKLVVLLILWYFLAFARPRGRKTNDQLQAALVRNDITENKSYV